MQPAVEMSQNEQFPEITNELFAHLFALYGVLDNTGRVLEIAGSIFDKTNIEPRLLRNQVFSETAFWQSSEANSRAVTVALRKAIKGNFVRLQAQFRVSSKERIPVELNFIPAGPDRRIYVCARLIDTSKYE